MDSACNLKVVGISWWRMWVAKIHGAKEAANIFGLCNWKDRNATYWNEEKWSRFDDAVKVQHSINQQIWKTCQWPQDWISFHFNPKEGQWQRMFKLPGFSSTWTKNFQMYKLGLEKTEEPETKLPTFVGPQRKQGNSRKTSISASLTRLKPLTVWITINCGKFFKRWEYQTTLPVFWETCMQVQEATVRSRHGTTEGSKLGKEYNKAVYCYLGYLTSIQSTSYEMSLMIW